MKTLEDVYNQLRGTQYLEPGQVLLPICLTRFRNAFDNSLPGPVKAYAKANPDAWRELLARIDSRYDSEIMRAEKTRKGTIDNHLSKEREYFAQGRVNEQRVNKIIDQTERLYTDTVLAAEGNAIIRFNAEIADLDKRLYREAKNKPVEMTEKQLLEAILNKLNSK